MSEVAAGVPRLVHYDPDRMVLVFELVPGAVSLGSLEGAFEADGLFVALGRSLGTLHRMFRRLGPESDPRLSWLERGPPWVMEVHKPTPGVLEDLSPANAKVLEILQGDEPLCERLEGLRRLWRTETLIHGDTKLDNVLALPLPTGAADMALATPRVWLVNWEMVQLGDPAWDLGGVLQEFLLHWAHSMPVSAALSAEERVAQARYPLADLRKAIRAAWRGYQDASGLDSAGADDLLGRAVAFSGAWLIQAACEVSYSSVGLSPRAVLLLQLAANVLADPGLARVQLYGIPGRSPLQ